MFSHLTPWKPHKCVLKPSEQGLFFHETIDLRGHMPRFTWKMNVFPSIFLEMPEMCVVTIRTGFIFLRWSIWSVTCLGWPEKWMFSHLSPWKPHKCLLKPSEQGFFIQDNQFEGSHDLGLLEKWMFYHLSPWKLHKWVLELSEQGSFFQDNQFEGSHA